MPYTLGFIWQLQTTFNESPLKIAEQQLAAPLPGLPVAAPKQQPWLAGLEFQLTSGPIYWQIAYFFHEGAK